ncbi:hypothetical protein H5410_043873, partial [Solanum commersonii]
VQASQLPGIKPDHIYITDDCLGAYLQFKEGGGLDMGVFNLADGSIQPHYMKHMRLKEADALKLSLCAGFGEGPNHNDIVRQCDHDTVEAQMTPLSYQ